MSLDCFMTATATTKRRPAPDVNNKIGDRTTYLENVKITPVMLPGAKGEHNSNGIGGGMDNFVYEYEAYTESHAHTKSSSPVTELPDIEENDLITIDSVSYTVRRAAIDTATSAFGKTLYLYLSEDNK